MFVPHRRSRRCECLSRGASAPRIFFMRSYAVDMRIFIDYWNFQLMWNERAGSASCDWKSLPGELTKAADSLLTKAGLGSVVLQETRVYAGYEAGREASL